MTRKHRVYCFEICREVRGIWFILGYCKAWDVDFPNGIVVVAPFTRGGFHSPLGTIPCRCKWRGPTRLPAQTHSIDPVVPQVWMEIEYQDLVLVAEYLESLRIYLPDGGYRRNTPP